MRRGPAIALSSFFERPRDAQLGSGCAPGRRAASSVTSLGEMKEPAPAALAGLSLT